MHNDDARVWNPDGNWSFRGCTFEGLAGNIAEAIEHDPGETIKGC
jgi:hypothetical protein